MTGEEYEKNDEDDLLRHDPVYYRVMRTHTGNVAVVEMQWFDEWDCDPTAWLTNEEFPTKAAAYAWIRQQWVDALERYTFWSRQTMTEEV